MHKISINAQCLSLYTPSIHILNTYQVGISKLEYMCVHMCLHACVYLMCLHACASVHVCECLHIYAYSISPSPCLLTSDLDSLPPYLLATQQAMSALRAWVCVRLTVQGESKEAVNSASYEVGDARSQ